MTERTPPAPQGEAAAPAAPPQQAPGVPPRPSPLPRPKPIPPGGKEGAVTAATVVPEKGSRPAPPRAPLARPAVPARGRRARLTVRRFDPWSVFVTSLLLSLCLAVVTMVAALVLYGVLAALGVPGSINRAVNDVNGSGALLTKGRFLGFGALVAAANVVLITTLATIGALLYNVCATFTGGVEVTLSERD